MLRGRFIKSVKNRRSEKEVPKSRYAVHDHTKQMKEVAVQDGSALRQKPDKTIFSCQAVNNVGALSHDVKQAYTQSKDQLS